jgi:hypothetical protein
MGLQSCHKSQPDPRQEQFSNQKIRITNPLMLQMFLLGFTRNLRTFSQQNRLLVHISWDLQKVYPLELKLFSLVSTLSFLVWM